MRAPVSIVFASALLASVVSGACGQEDPSNRVQIAPSVILPRGLLDSVKRIDLVVYETAPEVSCDAPNGRVSGVVDGTKRLATLAIEGCNTGSARFCADLDLPQAATARVFSASAFGADGRPLALGCASAVVNQESLPVPIKMVRFISPAVCGNSVIEPTEQCDPPGDDSDLLCDAECHSKEILISTAAPKPSGPRAGSAGQKVNPAFLWPAQTNAAGRFVAVWGDRTPVNPDLGMRVLNDGLGRLATSELGADVADGSIFIPNNPAAQAPYSEEANGQANPAIASAAGKYYVAFQDDSGGTLDIRMRSMIAGSLTPEQGVSAPLGINGTNGAGEPGAQTEPAIAAGPNGLLLIAWKDGPVGQPGRIVGRTFNTSSLARGDQFDISSSNELSQHVRLAATSNSWVAVWEGGSAIKLRKIGADGVPLGAAQTISEGSHQGLQDHPSIAIIDGGRFAVAWADHGASGGTNIFTQRFGADGLAVAGDQSTPTNDRLTDGEQISPVIASSSAAGGMFVVAWIDVGTAHVRARLLGAESGFLFNSVDGQDGEFQASLIESPRANPAVAIGGARPHIAIGWEDNGPIRPGIHARRFPILQ